MDMLASELRRISDYRMEVDGHNAYNNAFATTAFTTFDGAALISTSHVGLDGVTRTNRRTGAVQAGLTGFQWMIQDFHRLTNERGIPTAQGVEKVIITPEFLFTVREVLGSAYKPYTANNEYNALTGEGLTYMVDHYIDSTTAWFALGPDHDVNFNIMDRPMFDYFDDPRTWNSVFVVYQAHEPSQADEWREVYGNPGA